jgi:hypothetical protein
MTRQSFVDADKRRAPEEVGRAILGYRDKIRPAGSDMVPLWAALLRLAAVYGSIKMALYQSSK